MDCVGYMCMRLGYRPLTNSRGIIVHPGGNKAYSYFTCFPVIAGLSTCRGMYAQLY